MFSAVADGFAYLFGLIWNGLEWLLDGLYSLLSPIFDFLSAIFYFIYFIGLILFKIVVIVLTIVKLLIGLMSGLFKTIFGLAPSNDIAVIPSSYMDVFGKLQPIFNTLQLDKVAYLLSVGIWLFTAFVAVRIIGGMRGGGASSD